MSEAVSGRNRPVVKAVYLITPVGANDDGTFVLLRALAIHPTSLRAESQDWHG
jgi:hypothetical protein